MSLFDTWYSVTRMIRHTHTHTLSDEFRSYYTAIVFIDNGKGANAERCVIDGHISSRSSLEPPFSLCAPLGFEKLGLEIRPRGWVCYPKVSAVRHCPCCEYWRVKVLSITLSMHEYRVHRQDLCTVSKIFCPGFRRNHTRRQVLSAARVLERCHRGQNTVGI